MRIFLNLLNRRVDTNFRVTFLCFVLMFLFVPCALSNTVHTVTVPANDTSALISAINEANNAARDDETILLVSGNYIFSSEDGLPPISHTIRIEGYSSNVTSFIGKLDYPRNEPDQLLKIEEGGRLTLRHIDISDMKLSGIYTFEQLPLIENLGFFALEFVQFERMRGLAISLPFIGLNANELIVNNGIIVMNGVSFVDVGMGNVGVPPRGSILNNKGTAILTNVQVLFEDEGYDGGILNSGELRVLNSTFYGTSPDWHLPIYTTNSGTTQVGNSVFDGYDGEWCNEAESLGHNLVNSAKCNFATEGDIIGTPPFWKSLERIAVAWHGIDAHHAALTPRPASLMIDSANPIWCPKSDLLGHTRFWDGNGDGIAVCDRGAVEFTGSVLKTGGISGFYFDSQNDGHYIYVLDNPYNVLVVWNTFDRLGQQAWVYSTGTLGDNGNYEASAYINLGGQLTDLGPINAEPAEHWGKIKVQFDSCLKGHLWFESTDPLFGSGNFKFDRLAYVKQLGCSD